MKMIKVNRVKMPDKFEDMVLGYLAKERDENSKLSDYISAEDIEKNC